MSPAPIPFHRPSITIAEEQAVLDVMRSGWLTTGRGTLEFEEGIAAAVGTRNAVAVNSATAALHLALEALHLEPGDEVVVPSYTFAASGEVVRYLGARPRLADVDPLTLNLTAATAETQLTPRTRAIMVVHFGGLLADMRPILDLAERYGLAVIEDAAHALPCSRDGRAAGSWGTAGALSFYATKTVTTGEGGMLVTDDDGIADRARMMRLHGISRDAWKRYMTGGHWYYEIEDVGFKYNLTDLAAAIGLVQLSRAEEMRLERLRVARAYIGRFAASRVADHVDLPSVGRAGDVHAWHLFPLRLRATAPTERDTVIDHLGEAGIGTSVHFIPLHLHPYYRRTYGYQAEDLPVALAEYQREISLPIYPDLSDDEIERIVTSVEVALIGNRSARR